MQMTLQFIIAALSNKIVIQFLLYIKIFLKTDPYIPSQACFLSLPLGLSARARSGLHLLHCPLSSGSAHSARPGKSSSVPTHWLTPVVSHFPVNKNRQLFFKSQKYNMSPYTICSVDAFSKVI